MKSRYFVITDKQEEADKLNVFLEKLENQGITYDVDTIFEETDVNQPLYIEVTFD